VCCQAGCPKLSKSVHAWRNYSLLKMTVFGHSVQDLIEVEWLSSSFITPLAADNKIHTIHIKYIKNKNKKSYKVTVPAKTLHTASLTYTQLFVSKSIPFLQPIAMNLFWCSLDSAYSIELFEQCILYQNINLRWSIGSVLQKNWRGLVLSLQQHEKIRRKQLFQATLTLYDSPVRWAGMCPVAGKRSRYCG